MSTVSRYRRIAQITRAKGLTGEVVAVSAYSLPLHFWDEAPFFLVPPYHAVPRAGRVTEASLMQDGTSFLLKLSNIHDRTTAQKVVGCFLLMCLEDCPEFEEHISPSVLGAMVVDKTSGPIGTIVEERFGKAQTMWVIKGDLGEVLIPAVDDFIVMRDESSILVDLPKGLLELNA